jgi:hypothetical protein
MASAHDNLWRLHQAITATRHTNFACKRRYLLAIPAANCATAAALSCFPLLNGTKLNLWGSPHSRKHSTGNLSNYSRFAHF